MFLKSHLEDKLRRSLSDYDAPVEPVEKKQKRGFFVSKNEKLNFPMDHKKFNDDEVSQKARVAKEYVNQLIDPDFLELQKKRWNGSILPSIKEKPELKKTLFEVKNGLKDCKVIKLNPKPVEIGVDTRNASYDGFNLSTLLTNIEKRDIHHYKYLFFIIYISFYIFFIFPLFYFYFTFIYFYITFIF